MEELLWIKFNPFSWAKYPLHTSRSEFLWRSKTYPPRGLNNVSAHVLLWNQMWDVPASRWAPAGNDQTALREREWNSDESPHLVSSWTASTIKQEQFLVVTSLLKFRACKIKLSWEWMNWDWLCQFKAELPEWGRVKAAYRWVTCHLTPFKRCIYSNGPTLQHCSQNYLRYAKARGWARASDTNLRHHLLFSNYLFYSWAL